MPSALLCTPLLSQSLGGRGISTLTSGNTSYPPSTGKEQAPSSQTLNCPSPAEDLGPGDPGASLMLRAWRFWTLPSPKAAVLSPRKSCGRSSTPRSLTHSCWAARWLKM